MSSLRTSERLSLLAILDAPDRDGSGRGRWPSRWDCSLPNCDNGSAGFGDWAEDSILLESLTLDKVSSPQAAPPSSRRSRVENKKS